jgi:CPA2 family monovalent cation:H+ antiporter-2
LTDHLITTLVIGLVLAFGFGIVAQRLRLPLIVGYLLADIAIGPFTPGFVADADTASQLAELGVILLMFGVGLHFSLDDLLSVRGISIPGAIVQMAVATLLGLALALLFGWNYTEGVVFGLALSVASTVVLLKTLQDKKLVNTEPGKIAVGWLIVEDLAMVLVWYCCQPSPFCPPQRDRLT